jgi:AcrR family transcriptional regulator/DNA-binding transcriptional ArsR family regulator
MAQLSGTVDHPLVVRIARLDGEPGRREAVALGLVDSLLAADGETLGAALDALRDARARAEGELAGWLDAAIAVAHWGLERVPSGDAVAHGTQAHDFLRGLAGASQVGSAELRRLLEVDETQVSRTGRRLLERGLVTRRKAGRQVFWQLSPRGQRALEAAPAAATPNAEFWDEALRRGFRGDHEADPTREHVIACTLDLHQRQGIRATTWEQIAAAADVPVETVHGLFPTEDDLVRSCGAHLMETLRLPPGDLAPEVFAGASSEHERIHRLVETVFGAYERGADGIIAGRRERELPVVAESVTALGSTFDAIVAESLRPRRFDRSAVAGVRALTDVEVWRTLRTQGASPDAAVDQASAVVEGWLEAQR